jgi:hypothetical protein
MRESFGSIRAGFVKGLEPEPCMNDGDYLYRCHNARPTEVGLRPVGTVTYPLTGAPASASWPFPQLYMTQTGRKLLFYRTAIYDDQTLLLNNIPAGGIWHVAEYQGFWIAVNGAAIVVYRPWESVPAATLVPNIAATTVCAAGNSIVIGGLSGSALATLPVQRLFSNWKALTGQVTHGAVSLDDSWVMYWSIGGASSDQPFAAELSSLGLGTFTQFEGILADLVSAGRIGFARCGVGAVRAARPLGSNAVVYGANEVNLLDSVYGDDGVTRFRANRILDIGIGGRGHATGDVGVHWFVDTLGRLWAVGGDGPTRLGYEHYFAPLTASDSTVPLVAAYDPQEQEAWLSYGEGAYVLRKGQALYSRDGSASALTRRDGVLYGYAFGQSSGAFSVHSSQHDYNQRGMKTLQTVEASVQDVTGLQVAVQFRYGNETAFRTSTYIPANEDGAAYPLITAVDFRVLLQGTFGTNGRIDYCYHKWKFTGKRNVRGLYGQA